MYLLYISGLRVFHKRKTRYCMEPLTSCQYSDNADAHPSSAFAKRRRRYIVSKRTSVYICWRRVFAVQKRRYCVEPRTSLSVLIRDYLQKRHGCRSYQPEAMFRGDAKLVVKTIHGCIVLTMRQRRRPAFSALLKIARWAVIYPCTTAQRQGDVSKIGYFFDIPAS